ncbi:eEF1A lysine and N-terminal methyltransferase [Trichonephila inaurata madagascariensis]|uniref:EEF1A lysine and N-terminal methyltransferase n=1 Tax=Trichonephila inaurata madagascariensis TaxID=2747483 RepID=A0A8X6XBJ7_9ARAC|nr:eEF1A lysine and N-terminal methyltransferase [Trichonephila inaurata madagascariensis]
MDLLPKDHKDFGSKDYWNEFFAKQKSQPFEWYGEYDSLSDVLDKYIHPKNKVLVIGCGNSKLSADLYDVGICNSISVDISASVINQMKERYGRDRPKMSFEVMDVFKLPFEEGSFSVVIDKGTLDALLTDTSQEVNDRIDTMFSQIDKVLHNGGRYLCFSLLQEHVLNKLLEWFTDKGWLIRFHRCEQAEAKREDSLAFPVYAVVITKLRKIPGAPPVLEIVHSGIATPQRCTSISDILDHVKSAQHYAFLKHYLNKKDVVEEDICLELCSPDTGQVKYRMFVVDRKEKSSLKFAIFVVFQGRETEWLFSTPQGRQQLATNVNCERLIVVHLLRDNVYGSLEEVKNDLSAKVLELAPASCKEQVPILSLGDDVGQRDVKCKGKSDISGEFVVEDVLSNNDDLYRRLIFLNSPYIIQSEAKLMLAKKKKKGSSKLQINFDYIACDHHIAIISGFAFLKDKMLCPNILLIGLGGGTLPMYIHKHFPDANVEVVELDPCILDVAKKWFNLVTDNRLLVHIADGLTFIQEAVNKGLKYDIVILDVDNKDMSLGISGPPVAFLETTVLQNMSELVYDSGLVFINLACRNSELYKEAYSKLKSVFKVMYSRKIPEEVNEVIYCIKTDDQKNILNQTMDNYSSLTSFLEKRSTYGDVFDVADLASCLTEIT